MDLTGPSSVDRLLLQALQLELLELIFLPSTFRFLALQHIILHQSLSFILESIFLQFIKKCRKVCNIPTGIFLHIFTHNIPTKTDESILKHTKKSYQNHTSEDIKKIILPKQYKVIQLTAGGQASMSVAPSPTITRLGMLIKYYGKRSYHYCLSVFTETTSGLI